MSNEVSAALVYDMNNVTLNDFIVSIVAIFRADPAVELELGERLEASRAAFKASVIEITQKYGSTLKEIDTHNDLVWRSTRTALRNNLNHPQDDVQAAAKTIDDIFETWPQPTGMAYEKEYGQLDFQLSQLWAFGEPLLDKAQILPWVQELQGGVDAFKAMQLEKNKSKADVELGVTKKLKEQLIETYNDVMKRLNAKALLFPSDDLELLIARINQKIAEVKQKDKQAESAKKKKAEGASEDTASEA